MTKAEKAKLLKTVDIILIHNGENSDTIAPHCTVEETDRYDLTEIAQYHISYDNDMYIDQNKYKRKTISIPVWMEAKEYIENYVKWKYVWGMDEKVPYMPERYQRFLCEYKSSMAYSLSQLIKVKNPRSKFKISILEQVIDYINTPKKERQYNFPLSDRQYQAIRKPNYEWENISTGLYRSRNRFGVAVA
jgi:hypothetical protein